VKARGGKLKSDLRPAVWRQFKSGIEIQGFPEHPSAMRPIVLMGLLGGIAALAGCQQKTPPPNAAAPARQLPTHAQPKLRSIRIWLGAEELSAEIARTPMEQETGMMFRTNLDENAGMLFVFPHPRQASFWMTNCPLPLSAAYIDPQGAILEIHQLRANDPTPVVAESSNILFVLEVNQGWFARHHLEPGTIVTTEYGTLAATFLGPNP
jgi:hypothetical protein